MGLAGPQRVEGILRELEVPSGRRVDLDRLQRRARHASGVAALAIDGDGAHERAPGHPVLAVVARAGAQGRE